VRVALESLRRVKGLSLDEALAQEYRVGLRCLAGPDFREGIRAQVVDKDRNPQWKPATLHEVRAADVERYFAPLGDRELNLQSKEPDNV
jgi:enoyl-CoA hydratase